MGADQMRVRMRTLYAGPTGVAHPGDWIEVSTREGENLIGLGYAEPQGPPSQPDPRGGKQESVAAAPVVAETAELPPVETTEAEAPAPRRRRRRASAPAARGGGA